MIDSDISFNKQLANISQLSTDSHVYKHLLFPLIHNFMLVYIKLSDVMNFKRDIREIAEDQLIKYDLNFKDMEDDIDIIDRWINFRIRLIPTKKEK